MRLLLDTHIYLWAVSDDRKLSRKTRDLIIDAEEVFISSSREGCAFGRLHCIVQRFSPRRN
jgi:hypothetical protein